MSLLSGILFMIHPFLDIGSKDRIRRERTTESLMSEAGPPFGMYFLIGTGGGFLISAALYSKMKSQK